MEELYVVTKKDLNKVAKVLSMAFNHYILYEPIIEDIEKRTQFLYEMYSYLIKTTIRQSKIYATSTNFEGVIMYIDEKNYETSIGSIFTSGAIINIIKMCWIAKGTGIKKLLCFTKAIDTIHKSFSKENNMYLQAVAVIPEQQGNKFASKLIAKLLKDCENQHKGCYLETGDPKNVIIYQKYGFTLLEDRINDANGRKIFYLHHS